MSFRSGKRIIHFSMASTSDHLKDAGLYTAARQVSTAVEIHVCAVVYKRLFPTPLRIDVRSVRERKHRGRAKRHLQLLSLRCRRGRCHQSIWEHFAGKENLQMRGGLAAAHRARRSQARFLLAPAAISHVATSIASARLAGFGHLFLQIRYYEKNKRNQTRARALLGCWHGTMAKSAGCCKHSTHDMPARPTSICATSRAKACLSQDL